MFEAAAPMLKQSGNGTRSGASAVKGKESVALATDWVQSQQIGLNRH